MIPFFPDSYPDEIFSSILGRYFKRTGYPKQSLMMQEIFNSQTAMPSIDLIRNLDYLIEQLPFNHNYTTDCFIENHTLFPFYRPFLSQDNMSRLHQAMKSSFRTSKKRFRQDLAKSAIIISKFYQYCPSCLKDELGKYGEFYWHRLHQINGVKICPIHNNYLEKTDIYTKNTDFHFIFYLKKSLKDLKIKLVDFSDSCNLELLQISKDVSWLLKQSNLKISNEEIHLQYDCLLKNKKIDRKVVKEISKFENFKEQFISSFPLKFFNSISEVFELDYHFYCPRPSSELNSSLYDVKYQNWKRNSEQWKDYYLTRFGWLYEFIYLYNISHCNPLINILFIHFLEHTTESFFNTILKKQTLEDT